MTATRPTSKLIGHPTDRVDGRLKVTGGARFTADVPIKGIAYAYAVQSTIAAGRITSIRTSEAEAMAGVLTILTHSNAPQLQNPPNIDPFAQPYVLQGEEITHCGQYVAVVVAESFEQARAAARVLELRYEIAESHLSFEGNLVHAFIPDKLLLPFLKPVVQRGAVDHDLHVGEIYLEATYKTAILHANPMEPHATTAVWNGDCLTVYDSAQNVNRVQSKIAGFFGLPPANVRVIAQFVGGGFGSKAPVWEHVVLAVMAAQLAKRPVKLVLTRQQMFAGTGYRPSTRQQIRLWATPDGCLTALSHDILTPTNIAREYVEHAGEATPYMYTCPRLLVKHSAVPLNWPRASIMRGPGVACGMFGLECAMDELAAKLSLDPIELRRRNEPESDPDNGLPWSSRSLMDCFERGAAAFGWERRNPAPQSMRSGRMLVGYGVAAATYRASYRPCSARVRVSAESVLVQLAATDIGTGTYTVLAQIAAEALGLSPESVTVQIGDSIFPPTPGSGGCWGATSYGTAVHEACQDAMSKLILLAQQDPESPLKPLRAEEIKAHDGGLAACSDSTRHVSYATLFQRQNVNVIGGEAQSQPGEIRSRYSAHAFGAQFAEVQVDPDVLSMHVSRYVGAFACGRILNAKTARSQLAGGIVMGLGMAMTEETLMDERFGQFVNADLAEYHVPVNSDLPLIEIILVEEQDAPVNPIGTKGVGEIGPIGVAAAVANAVYHATGKRVRNLPIRLDTLL